MTLINSLHFFANFCPKNNIIFVAGGLNPHTAPNRTLMQTTLQYI